MFSIRLKRAMAKRNGQLHFKPVDDLHPDIRYYIWHKIDIHSREHVLIDRIKDEIRERIDFNVWNID